MDLYDKFIYEAQKKRLYTDEESIERKIIGSIIARSLNRLSSENAWKKRITAYFLHFALCKQLGLSTGNDNSGLNETAKFRLAVIINGLYDGVRQSWDNLIIIN